MTTESANTLAVARQAFAHFEHGLATGEWQAFFDMLTDDFSFWFPLGQFKGLNVGKARAIEFFNYVSEVYSTGLTLTLDRVTSNETTVVFEFRDEGLMWGKPYKNRVALSLDVRDDKICGYREYLGSDGQSN
jgi:ketosteroid isomerase-like protein